MHKISTLILLTVATAAALQVGTEQRAEAATVVRVLEWNMCGSACHGGNNVPVNWLKNAINNDPNPTAWVVTLNEVCWSQFQSLDAYFIDLKGYDENAFSTTRTQSLPSGCGGKYGNAMWLLGTSYGDTCCEFEYLSQWSEQPLEKRRLECRKMGSSLGNYAGCVTHLVNNASTAESRSVEAASHIGTWYPTTVLRLVGGDFNLSNLDALTPTWVYHYDDADPNGGFTHAIGNLTRRIDYIWRDEEHPSDRLPYLNCSSSVESDHCYKRGRFTFS